MGTGELSGKPDEILGSERVGGGSVTCVELASDPGGVAIRQFM